jgi:eukaryotic-like serine/threonine-protein kinase
MSRHSDLSARLPGASPVEITAISQIDQTPMPVFEEEAETNSCIEYEALGHYRVLGLLGQGGFGTVLKAYDSKLLRVVALKVMAKELATTSPARKRFLREARAGAAVGHENVVRIYAVEEHPLPYLVMEYVAGVSLQDHLNTTGPLSVPDVLRTGAKIARGLAAAHKTGLIHRDIKPANVMLESGDSKSVKLTDFGLARTRDDASLTQSGLVAGTPMYMSPEQARGEIADHRSDLFSLGSVLYVMVTGRPPFNGTTPLSVMRRVAEEKPHNILDLIPETPRWLVAVIEKLHAKQPGNRYATADEVAQVLERGLIAWEMGVREIDLASQSGALPVPLAGRSPRRFGPAIALGAIVGLSLGVVAYLAYPLPPQLSPEPVTARTPASSPSVSPETPIAAVPEKSPERKLEELKAAFEDRFYRENPRFRGNINYRERDGQVYRVEILDSVGTVNFAALKHFGTLTEFVMNHGTVLGLESLRGLKLQKLQLVNVTGYTSMAGIEEMPLHTLGLWGFSGTDLSPLRGKNISELNLGGGWTELDLEPLRGMKTDFIWLNCTDVKNIDVLSTIECKRLFLEHTKITDLTPLKNLSLKLLSIQYNGPLDLSPLRGMDCEHILLDYRGPKDIEILKTIKNLKKVNDLDLQDFLANPRNIKQ